MAHYQGYISVPHGSYQEWRDATLGNGYNVDYYGGEQCWDYPALLYYQYGLTLITKAGGGGAQDCWIVSRQANSRPPFESIDGVANIKRGDIVVFGGGLWGHIAFADEDYHGGTRLWCLGQNQQGTGTGWPVTRDNLNLLDFLGIFRNTQWSSSPTPPEPSEEKNKRSKFPWAIALHHWYKKH